MQSYSETTKHLPVLRGALLKMQQTLPQAKTGGSGIGRVVTDSLLTDAEKRELVAMAVHYGLPLPPDVVRAQEHGGNLGKLLSLLATDLAATLTPIFVREVRLAALQEQLDGLNARIVANRAAGQNSAQEVSQRWLITQQIDAECHR